MNIQTGIDIEEIVRVKDLLKNPNFLDRFFGSDEIKIFIRRGMKPQIVAANFCAKEALAKALGTGIRGFSLKEIQILRDDLGCPYFQLSGKVKELCKNYKLSVSISHTDQYATAVAIAYSDEKQDA